MYVFKVLSSLKLYSFACCKVTKVPKPFYPEFTIAAFLGRLLKKLKSQPRSSLHGPSYLGHSTSKISDALGHKTEDVTRAYLESFMNEELDEMNRGIL